jgi:nucleotide-binding universal stress UspA family protein
MSSATTEIRASAFERLVIGLDGAGVSANALVAGLTLANDLRSAVRIVHAAQELPSPWPDLGLHGSPGRIAEVEAEAFEAASVERARKRVAPLLADACGQTGRSHESLENLLHVLPGHPALVLLKEAEDFRADLLVLGPHAKRHFLDFGSTTRAVLSRSPIPVWTQAEPFTAIRRILVPVDLSDHSALTLDHAFVLAGRLRASLAVLHCWEPPVLGYSTAEDPMGPTYVVEHEREQADETFRRWIEARGRPAQAVFCEGTPVQRILEESDAADLVVMGTHGRTGLARFLLGSVAYAVLKQCRKPVLLVPSPRGSRLLGQRTAAAPIQAVPLRP